MKKNVFCWSICLISTFSSPLFADITLTLNSGEFVLHDNGTVTDSVTHLIWQSCAVGQTWDVSAKTCTGRAQVFTYANAMKITSDFADKTDWRLPSLIELNAIVELKTNNHVVNNLIFPQMPTDKGFISSTIYAAKTQSLTWIVLTNSGKNTQPTGANTESGHYVRLVRGRILAATTAPTMTAPTMPADKADLNVTLSVSSNPAKLNQFLTYTIDVTNKSRLTATDTLLSFYLTPSLMRYDSASANCEKSGDSVICKMGDVRAGEHVSKAIRVVMQKVGATSSSASVQASEADANEQDNQAKITVSIKK